MSFGSGSSYSYDIDFNVNGQADIDRADTSFETFTTSVGEYAVACTQATTASDKLTDALQNQAKAANAATTATQGAAQANNAVADSANNATAATNKTTAAVTATGKAAGGAVKDMGALARAILGSSQAASDFSVAGPLGAMNNLGPIAGNLARAFGASATAVNVWAAGLEVAGAVLFGVYKNWDTIVGAFSEGLPKEPIADVKELKKELEALTEKPWKTVIDYADMTSLLIQIGEAERRKAALAKADGPTDEEGKRAKAVVKAVTEAREEKVIDAVAASTPIAESPATREAKEKAASFQATINDKFLQMNFPEAVDKARVELEKLKVLIGELNQSDRASHRTAAGNKVADALLGQDAARQQLEKLARDNAEIFGRFKIGPEFAEALAKASPAAMAKAEKDKELDKASKNVIRVIGDAFEEQVLRPLTEVARAGGDLKKAVEQIKPALTQGFVNRKVEPELAAKSAENFLKSMAEKAQNLAATGKQTPGEKEQATAQEKAIGDAYGDVKGAFAGDLVEQLVKAARAGGDVTGEAEKLRAGLADRVGARPEVDNPVIAAGVVERLLKEAISGALDIMANGKKTPAEKQADTDEGKAVREAVSGYAGTEQAEANLYTRTRVLGQDEGQAREAIRAEVEANLASLGPKIAGLAAAEIAKQVDEKVAKHVANGTQPAAIRRDQADRKSKLDAVDDGFIQPIIAAIVRNRELQMAGAPVARSRKEVERFESVGQDYALRERDLAAEMAKRIAVDLRNSGQDPGLAPDLVRRGYEKLQGAITKQMPNVTDPNDAVSRVGNAAQAAVDKARQGPQPRPAKPVKSGRAEVDDEAPAVATVAALGPPPQPVPAAGPIGMAIGMAMVGAAPAPARTAAPTPPVPSPPQVAPPLAEAFAKIEATQQALMGWLRGVEQAARQSATTQQAMLNMIRQHQASQRAQGPSLFAPYTPWSLP